MRARTFTITTDLNAPASVVWARVATMRGVNDELAPLVRMTVPAEFRERSIDEWQPGAIGFSSWILLLRLIPFDLHFFGMDHVEPGRSFAERSSSLLQKEWRHERTVEPIAPGRCRVTDRVTFEPRLPLVAWLLRPIFRFVFQHRHRRLRARFGAGD